MNLASTMIENITKQTYESQNQRLRLFARVDLKMKLHILQLQKQFFHKLKSAYGDVDNTVLTLSSLIVAIDSVIKKLDIANLNAIKIKGKSQKTKVKREKVLGYWAIVRILKLEQNMSFRQIAKYFYKYHKFEISHSMIQKTWNELEHTKEEKDNVK
ncbi:MULTISPECIES: hypothetical protein [unclassified Sulfurospirillum]|uniref:hypothetical protein n=1 Tax=unclassified Sulfurospirillum TaxID=2618290 RepID=UPI00050317D9|nr:MULTISPECIES: hypothetical protein [unclassified Sulfurospirillum]KFL35007.1 hypothetical protein JU57_03335 [Sulfurospirillum sp. SCADC]